MSNTFSTPPGGKSPADQGSDDPCSWLQIEQGWSVVASDGTEVGTVAQVEGDKNSDIFDGLAVTGAKGEPLRYVPGEQVGRIVPGCVSLKLGSNDLGPLAPFEAAPPETKWTPGPPSLGTRLSNWLGGKR